MKVNKKKNKVLLDAIKTEVSNKRKDLHHDKEFKGEILKDEGDNYHTVEFNEVEFRQQIISFTDEFVIHWEIG